MGYCTSNITVAGSDCDNLEISGENIYCQMYSIPFGITPVAIIFGNETYIVNVTYLYLLNFFFFFDYISVANFNYTSPPQPVVGYFASVPVNVQYSTWYLHFYLYYKYIDVL